MNLSNAAEVNALALHPSGTMVASACADGTFSIIDLTTDKPSIILTLNLPAEAAEGTANTAIAFHPDGGMVGVGSSDSSVRIYDLLAGACVGTFTAHSEVAGAGAVTSISFSQNGYIFASSVVGSNQVKLSDLRKLSTYATIDLPEGNVINALAFDDSAQFLAVGGTDLRVYANKTFEQLAVVEENKDELSSLCWGADSKEIVVVGIDRNARIVAAPVE